MPEDNEEKKVPYAVTLATEKDLEKIDTFYNTPDEHKENMRKLQLQQIGNGKFFVIKSEEEIIGFAFLYFDHQSVHFPRIRGPFVEDFIINPKFRKMGFGKMLLDLCEKEIRAREGKELVLIVTIDNREAVHFFVKNDFFEIPETRYAWPPVQPVNSMYMRKEF